MILIYASLVQHKINVENKFKIKCETNSQFYLHPSTTLTTTTTTMKFAIIALVVAMVSLSEGYLGFGLDYPGYGGYPGVFRKSVPNVASATYEYTNSNGDECECKVPVLEAAPPGNRLNNIKVKFSIKS